MAGLDLAVTAIRDRVLALWPEPNVPLAFLNNPNFTPPTAADGSGLPWVLVRVLWNPAASGFESIGAPGNNLARRAGHIWLYGFVGRGTGEELAHRLVSQAASIFEGADFAGIVCQAMEPGGEADSEDGNYFGQSAAIPFDYDETA